MPVPKENFHFYQERLPLPRRRPLARRRWPTSIVSRAFRAHNKSALVRVQTRSLNRQNDAFCRSHGLDCALNARPKRGIHRPSSGLAPPRSRRSVRAFPWRRLVAVREHVLRLSEAAAQRQPHSGAPLVPAPLLDVAGHVHRSEPAQGPRLPDRLRSGRTEVTSTGAGRNRWSFPQQKRMRSGVISR